MAERRGYGRGCGRPSRAFLLLVAVVASALAVAPGASGAPGPSPSPTIKSFNPPAGTAGQTVQITGTHVGDTTGGPQTQYALGQAPNYRMAVSDDGRYVAFGQAFDGTSIFVEDLSKCPSQSPLTGAFQCQTIDVSSVLAALLPGYYRATPWQFTDDHTLVVYAAYKDANGVTHQAKVTMISAAG